MINSKKLAALVFPFLGLIVGVAIFLDGTLAVAAQPSLSAPLNKQTSILEVASTQSSHEMASAATCTIPPTKILPVGDSITLGQNSSHDAGYRLPLYLSLRNAGHNVQFVGSEVNGPTPGFDYYHEGIPGIETFAVVDAMGFYLANNDPDYILLHLGTNDMRKGGFVTETVVPEINDLLNEVDVYELAESKTITVVVAQIISEACGSPATPKCTQGVDNTIIYNQALQELVDDRILAGDNLIIVDMENGANLNYAKVGGDFADELHPNDVGYEKMAGAWFDALITDLPAACATPPLIVGDAVTETAVSNRYTHQITASGEPTISFSLNITSPTGMSIDPVSGLLSWIPTMAQLGSNNVGVVATSNAGTDSYNFNINVINGGVAVIQEPHNVTLLVNDPLTFTVFVTNTGTLTLTDVPVEFPLTPSCDVNLADLDPGTSSQISCFVPSVPISETYPVYITATDSSAAQWAARDSSSVTVIDPQIEIAKTAVSSTILTNSTANYTVTITNTGDVDLTNVEVVDPITPNCSDSTIGTLIKGQSIAYGCSFSNATANIFSTATVTGTHEIGQVSDSDSESVTVINPSIEIVISPDSQPVLSGGDVTFTVAITNSGDTTLTNLSVVDTAVPNCATTIPSLAPGAAHPPYSCTLNGVSTDFYNNATVTGDHLLGQVSANDSVLVDLFSTDIDFSVTANEYAMSGATVDFNITITNTSGTEMSPVIFTDSATGCSVTLPTLADGATHINSCTALNATTDITNTINVTASLPLGGEASNSDIATVTVIDPSIDVTLTPASQEINMGETALFTVTVANMGDIELSNVQVTSAVVADCNNDWATVAAQATVQYSCEISGATDDVSNKVIATGTHPLGKVTAEETAVVDIGLYTLFLPMIINP